MNITREQVKQEIAFYLSHCIGSPPSQAFCCAESLNGEVRVGDVISYDGFFDVEVVADSLLNAGEILIR